jgi:hypothetical protein
MAVRTRDRNNTDKVIKALRKLDGKKIKVGIMGDEDAELKMIASVHEYGAEIKVTPAMRGWFAANGYPLKKNTTKITIPERSFIRSGFDENVNKIAQKIENLVPRMIEGQVDPKIFMDMIGLEFAGMIQDKLRNLRNPANSSMTKERKGSSNPLVDSGRLVGAIRHKVE